MPTSHAAVRHGVSWGRARLPDVPGATGCGATYRAIFVVLYALGLRVGEVCG